MDFTVPVRLAVMTEFRASSKIGAYLEQRTGWLHFLTSLEQTARQQLPKTRSARPGYHHLSSHRRKAAYHLVGSCHWQPVSNPSSLLFSFLHSQMFLRANQVHNFWTTSKSKFAAANFFESYHEAWQLSLCSLALIPKLSWAHQQLRPIWKRKILFASILIKPTKNRWVRTFARQQGRHPFENSLWPNLV